MKIFIFGFLGGWLGIMAVIAALALVVSAFSKKKEQKTTNGEEYARRFEEEMAQTTPEKPIKKHMRNPFALSQDEIEETLKDTKQ